MAYIVGKNKVGNYIKYPDDPAVEIKDNGSGTIYLRWTDETIVDEPVLRILSSTSSTGIETTTITKAIGLWSDSDTLTYTTLNYRSPIEEFIER